MNHYRANRRRRQKRAKLRAQAAGIRARRAQQPIGRLEPGGWVELPLPGGGKRLVPSALVLQVLQQPFPG